MVEIELDGKKVEVAEGSMVMHAAEKAGTYIPHFCYTRSCPSRPTAACAWWTWKAAQACPPAPPGDARHDRAHQERKAIKAQQSVMEFLLINHPLDCPICDQGGECQLQDLAVGWRQRSRYEEESAWCSTRMWVR
jgi:NADH-quinone oxidoreductase subunit G